MIKYKVHIKAEKAGLFGIKELAVTITECYGSYRGIDGNNIGAVTLMSRTLNITVFPTQYASTRYFESFTPQHAGAYTYVWLSGN